MSATEGYRVNILYRLDQVWQPVGPVFATRDAALIAGAASYGLSKYGETWNVVPTIQAFTVS